MAVSGISAAATLALGTGLFITAAPASAESVGEPVPTATATPTAEPTPAPTAEPTPTPTPTTPAPEPTPTPAPPKEKASGPKAKVTNYSRLTKKAKKVANKVRDDWRKVKSIGGWRAGSKYSGDHPAGRAIDVMIPSWKKNADLGWSIAKYFANKSNAKKYHIHYVIFRQQIWTVQTPRWRKMANRGGATANHFDHVHISVKR
ncbi:MAG: hypothetical protein QM582_06270 [Micropruina sp.]|uniref:hypothetical protein n=1 Tax=Micropruina sp. TaxID=2737536 RepID=UPI0039E51007